MCCRAMARLSSLVTLFENAVKLSSVAGADAGIADVAEVVVNVGGIEHGGACIVSVTGDASAGSAETGISTVMGDDGCAMCAADCVDDVDVSAAVTAGDIIDPGGAGTVDNTKPDNSSDCADAADGGADANTHAGDDIDAGVAPAAADSVPVMSASADSWDAAGGMLTGTDTDTDTRTAAAPPAPVVVNFTRTFGAMKPSAKHKRALMLVSNDCDTALKLSRGQMPKAHLCGGIAALLGGQLDKSRQHFETARAQAFVVVASTTGVYNVWSFTVYDEANVAT